MDIVDIDKVLDDFELNEDNGYNNSINTQHNTAPLAAVPQQITQQTSTAPSKPFVNVSNVFHSLNEYVNAGGIETPPQYVEEQTSEEQLTTSTTSSITPNSESKAKFVYEKPLLSGSLMTSSSSSSSTTSSTESSTTDLSRSITSSVSLIRNQGTSPSLTNDDDVCKETEIDETKDISLVPNTKTEPNDEQIGFSSVSSLCLNDQISSSQSYSQDIISNESSSLSPLDPPTAADEPPVPQPIDQVIEVVEVEPKQEVVGSVLPTKPVGFESTMDDVSDTELESYLQELELEPVLNESSTVNCETVPEIDEPQTEKVVDQIEPVREVSEASEISVEDRNQQNADSFSQASTIEFADTRLHSDFEQSPSAENVRVEKVEVTDTQDELSEAEVAVEDGPSPYEKPLQRPNSLDLAVKVVVESECHADEADQTPTEQVYVGGEMKAFLKRKIENSKMTLQAPPPPVESSVSADISNATSTSSSDDFGASASGSSNNQPTISQLGKVQPYWIPDNVTTTCMQCQIRFSIIKRRHHCRACGQVLCSACCSMRAKLEYMGDVEARVCTECERKLNSSSRDYGLNSPSTDEHSSDRPTMPPNPNNPMEYCSVIPPHQQVGHSSQASPISVMVPVGVLKREGARGPRKDKNVMFSDGIRPGCDLTDLDNWNGGGESGSKKSNKRVSTPISEWTVRFVVHFDSMFCFLFPQMTDQRIK